MAKVSTPEVVVDKVGSLSVIKQYEAPARIVSKYQVNIEARISGYLLKSYLKKVIL